MKKSSYKVIFCLMAGGALSSSAAIVDIPDGDFETGALGAWVEVFDGGTFSYEYPVDDGNPAGHVLIDHLEDDGGFGILIANNDEVITLASLGLTAGEKYRFYQDMFILVGDSIGGLKIDFFTDGASSGSTGDMYPTLIGDGIDWESYTFDVTIPEGVDGIKVVLLWGEASLPGFDNIQVDNEPIPVIRSIPNGDFEMGGTLWETNSGGGTFSFDFPETGGNPGGHGVIDNSAGDGGWGLFVTNDGVIIPLDGLGLVPGESYKFSEDMKIVSGDEIGGFKIDFFNGDAFESSTGDLYPTLIGTGDTWETYDFEITVPIGADGLKLVPLWGPGSVVGIDNVTFDSTPIEVEPVEGIPNGDFEEGDSRWVEVGAPNTTFRYPESGGNPGGYGEITNDGGGFGLWVANGGASLPLAAIGLDAGKTYLFQQDMILLDGANFGGFKVDFFTGATANGSTGDIFPEIKGDGSTWETYDFLISIPSGTDGIKVVPLWASGSTVGYDNVTFSDVALVTPPITNHDFEMGASGWRQIGDADFSFPDTGGNPDGHGIIDHSGGDFAILIANDDSIISLEDLGLQVGNSYVFLVDMKLFAGSNIGGFKVDFFTGNDFTTSTGDLFPQLIGDGSSWETYEFAVDVPEDIDGVKLVPLWGAGSRIGFDNIRVVTDQTFDDWIAGFPGVGVMTGFNDDADGDGSHNGLENFFGTDPSVSSEGLLSGLVTVAGTRSFSFTHSQNATPVDDLSAPSYSWSTDLLNFYPDGEDRWNNHRFISSQRK